MKFIRSYIVAPGISVTPESLKILAAKKYDITVAQLMTRTRKQPFVEARQYAAFLMREEIKVIRKYSKNGNPKEGKYPFQAIAKALKLKNHATVIHAVDIIRFRKDHNQLLKIN